MRGREAMASVSAELNQERNDQQSDDGIEQGEASSERGNKCKVCGLKFNQCGCQAAADEVRQLSDAGSEEDKHLSERGPRKILRTCEGCKLDCQECVCQMTKKKETPAADEARERALLRQLYAALVAPVEEHLTGAEEVLIVPHKELF